MPGAVDDTTVAAMRARLWSLLAGRGVDPDDRDTWPSGPVSGLRSLRRGEAGPDAAPRVHDVLDAVFGAVPRTAPGHWGQALVGFPEEEPWAVPRTDWHCDFPFWFPADEVWGTVG